MANPQDELNLRLLLLNLYGRRGWMGELDNPDLQGEETGAGENKSLLSGKAASLPEVTDDEE